MKNKSITLTVDGDSNCTITPTSRHTTAILTDINGTVNFIVDGTLSQIGDELVIIAKQADGGSWVLQFIQANGAILTSCGSPMNLESFNPTAPTWIGHFFFDGNLFLNCYDNC